MQITVLLVEDHKDVRNTVEELLSKRNLKVTAVSSGKEAFRLINEEIFDIVVSDIRMDDNPELWGHNLVKAVKNISPNTITILMSTDRFNYDDFVDSYVCKSLLFNQLTDVLAKLIPELSLA